jgi:preprotein translocase subunit SecA
MALADIQERSAEERKREKRLVHLTNALSRDFTNSKSTKSKTKLYKDTADYIAKSFLDYVFFEEKKEIREVNDTHIQHFMLTYAPRKLTFTTEGAKKFQDILSDLLIFLETDGHIKNGIQLSDIVKQHNRSFLKLIPKTTTTSTKKRKVKDVTPSKKKRTKKATPEIKVGRNDPCPCGSGKKYKKCCGRLK